MYTPTKRKKYCTGINTKMTNCAGGFVLQANDHFGTWGGWLRVFILKVNDESALWSKCPPEICHYEPLGQMAGLQEITSPSLPEFAEFSHLSCGAADHGRPLGEALRGEKLIRRRFCRGSDQLSRAGDMNKGIAHLLYWMAELGMKLGKILRLQRVTLHLLRFKCRFHVKTSHLEAMFGDLSHSSLGKLVNFLSFTICQNMKHWPPLTIETCNPSKKRIIGHTS